MKDHGACGGVCATDDAAVMHKCVRLDKWCGCPTTSAEELPPLNSERTPSTSAMDLDAPASESALPDAPANSTGCVADHGHCIGRCGHGAGTCDWQHDNCVCARSAGGVRGV